MSLIEPLLGTLFIVVPIIVLTCVPVIVILYKVYQRMTKCNFCIKRNSDTGRQTGVAEFHNDPIEWSDTATPTGDDEPNHPDTDPDSGIGGNGDSGRKASTGLGWYHHRPGWMKKNQRPNQWMMRGGFR